MRLSLLLQLRLHRLRHSRVTRSLQPLLQLRLRLLPLRLQLLLLRLQPLLLRLQPLLLRLQLLPNKPQRQIKKMPAFTAGFFCLVACTFILWENENYFEQKDLLFADAMLICRDLLYVCPKI